MKWDVNGWESLVPFVERLQEKLEKIQQARPLPTTVLNKLQSELALEWTYNSNSIEGNTLSLHETRLVLEDGITVGGKSIREYFETLNHERAIQYLMGLVSNNYTVRSIDILKIHELVMQNIDLDFAGRLRNAGVRITGANFTPPAASKVSDLLDELIEFTNQNPLGLPIPILAGVFHHRLVWIHPFFDGNGRTVRLVMNLLLMKYGFPAAIILKNDRKKYYDALNQANTGNYQKICMLVCQALERSLNIYIGAMPGKSYEDYQPITSIVSEPTATYSAEYVSLLARTGKIDAYKEGRNWVTSKEAVENYISNKNSRKSKKAATN
jgi:Fic family protein